MLVQIHCYRADEFLNEMAMAREFGYKVRAFHHELEGYKNEAWDAIPWNAVMSMRKGVTVAIKSDSNDYMRRLNQEAAKAMRYGGATEDEALRMITLNAAWL